MKSISLIGGSGFIGSRLSKRLNAIKDLKVVIVDKNKSNIFPDQVKIADVRFIDQLRDVISSNSIIINLAAEHKDDIQQLNIYYDVNVNGAKNICNVAREKNIKSIIFTSSVAVYGFAPLGTNESGAIAPFNHYGKSKWEAEQVYMQWQSEAPLERTLTIIRPTVVFGEGNRGNVFNLLAQIASGKFVMIGNGLNRKSMAYVENVSAFLEFSLDFKPGVHIYNYIDKPDFTMSTLVSHVNKLLLRSPKINLKVPFFLGLLIGMIFDLFAKVTGKKFPISAIRVKKFCANSVYDSAVDSTGFIPPVSLMEAIEKTVYFEFIGDHKAEQVFYTE